MKLTLLAEDCVRRGGLVAEHGFSLLIESDGEEWLFDAGQMDSAARNARYLGIDLRALSGIILSHGHYDHTAGLLNLLEVCGHARVLCHHGIFRKRYKLTGSGKAEEIGPPWRRKRAEDLGAAFHFNRRAFRLSRSLILSGEIEKGKKAEKGFCIREGGRLRPDPFQDEQALFFMGKRGITIILGCGHKGLLPTVEQALSLSGGGRLFGVVGGAHLLKEHDRMVDRIIKAIKKWRPRLIALNHCTGMKALQSFREAFPGEFVPFHTGDTLEIN